MKCDLDRIPSLLTEQLTCMEKLVAIQNSAIQFIKDNKSLDQLENDATLVYQKMNQIKIELQPLTQQWNLLTPVDRDPLIQKKINSVLDQMASFQQNIQNRHQEQWGISDSNDTGLKDKILAWRAFR